jgi:putative ABC transport system permease protein
MIGVTSLMGMVATLSGLEKFIAASISGEGTPILSLAKVNFLAGEGHKEWEKRKNFTIDDALALEELPHVAGVEVEYGRGVVAKYKNRKAQLIQLAGSNQPLLQVQSINIATGRYFTQSEQEHRRNVVVLGDKAAKSLFPDEDPLGKSIRINGEEYEVIGVFGNRKTIFGGFAENFMVIPYTAFERDFLFHRQELGINVIVEDARYVDEVEESMRALMRMRRRCRWDSRTTSPLFLPGRRRIYQSITDKITLALLVLLDRSDGRRHRRYGDHVGFGHRAHAEIGVRKAIGATRGQITWQF